MFWLYALSVDVLRKVQYSINWVVVRKQRNSYSLQKNALFDILSLANQLHRSKSTYLKSPECGKIYFSEGQVPNLIGLGLNLLPQAIKAYKKAVRKNYVNDKKALDAEPGNETIDELFKEAKDNAAVISNLEDLYE